MSYLIGQRVIVDRRIIAVVIESPRARPLPETEVWVRLPSGVEQWRAHTNVEPLPGGQL